MKKFKEIEWIIIGIITFLICTGLELAFLGQPVGIVIGSIGILAFAAGWKSISASPIKVGAVTRWGDYLKTGEVTKDATGKIIKDGRKTITIRGKTILAPYFPFFIDVVEIDTTSMEWIFDVVIYSVEGLDSTGKQKSVPVSVKIRLTVSLDENHADWFIMSGGDLAKIKALMEGIPYREVQKLVKSMPGGDNNEPGLCYMEVVQQGNLISEELEKRLNGSDDVVGIFEDKFFGVKCSKVQIEATIPEDIQQSMKDAASIVYETDARAIEYGGDVKATKDFMTGLGLTDGEKAWNMAVQSRLMRDGSIQRLQIENVGNGAPMQGIIIRDTNVHMAGDGKKGKKGN